MNDRSTVLAMLVATLLLEALLLIQGGFLAWLTAGTHSVDELRELLVDWRVILSVGLVAVILWLAVRWFRLGAVGKNDQTQR